MPVIRTDRHELADQSSTTNSAKHLYETPRVQCYTEDISCQMETASNLNGDKYFIIMSVFWYVYIRITRINKLMLDITSAVWTNTQIDISFLDENCLYTSSTEMKSKKLITWRFRLHSTHISKWNEIKFHSELLHGRWHYILDITQSSGSAILPEQPAVSHQIVII